jgi:hypothetical protein
MQVLWFDLQNIVNFFNCISTACCTPGCSSLLLGTSLNVPRPLLSSWQIVSVFLRPLRVLATVPRSLGLRGLWAAFCFKTREHGPYSNKAILLFTSSGLSHFWCQLQQLKKDCSVVMRPSPTQLCAGGLSQSVASSF